MTHRCKTCIEPYPPQSARFTAVIVDRLLSLLIDSWGVDLGRRPAFFGGSQVRFVRTLLGQSHASSSATLPLCTALQSLMCCSLAQHGCLGRSAVVVTTELSEIGALRIPAWKFECECAPRALSQRSRDVGVVPKAPALAPRLGVYDASDVTGLCASGQHSLEPRQEKQRSRYARSVPSS